MVVDDNFKFLGLLAVALLAIGLAFVPLKWPKGRHYSFSQHVASRKSSVVYYALLFIVTLPLLNLFIISWFVPSFELSPWFAVLAVVSSVAQIACTFIPEVGGRLTECHRLLAGVSGLLLLPATILLLLSQSVTSLNKGIVVISLVAMLSVIIFVSTKKGHPSHFLWLQIVYYVAFFVPILSIAYLQ